MVYVTNGYRGDLAESLAERRLMLHDRIAYGAAMDHGLSDLCVYSLEDLVAVANPDELAKSEDQQQMKSCGGHGGTTAFERCHEIDTGIREQFSRMWLYLVGQAKDGIHSDDGMSISGGVMCLKEDGCCPESVFPYTGVYSRNIPIHAKEEAAKYKLGSAVDATQDGDPNDYMQRFLGHNLGAAYNGCQWNRAMANPVNGIIEQWVPARNAGGHAWAFVGLAERTDSQGRHYYWLANSHSMRWGIRGFAMMSPAAYAGMCSHKWTETFGISKLILPQKKKKVVIWNLAS